MSRVELLNQFGTKKGLLIGPMSIDRNPSTFNQNSIPDWTSFCNDVDQILKAGTCQVRLHKFASILLSMILFVPLILMLLDNGAGDGNGGNGDSSSFGVPSYFWLMVVAVVLLNFVLYIFVMKRIYQVMMDLKAFFESKEESSNTSSRIRYDLQSEPQLFTPLNRRYYILVVDTTTDGGTGANANANDTSQGDIEATTGGGNNTNSISSNPPPPALNPVGDALASMIAAATTHAPVVVPSPSAPSAPPIYTRPSGTTNVVHSSNVVYSEPAPTPSTTMSSPAYYTGTQSNNEYSTTSNNNNNTGTTKTSIFDQLNSGT